VHEKTRLEAKIAQLSEQLGGKEQLSSQLQVVESEKGNLDSKIKELELQIKQLNEVLFLIFIFPLIFLKVLPRLLKTKRGRLRSFAVQQNVMRFDSKKPTTNAAP
jgi:hypothetical protein